MDHETPKRKGRARLNLQGNKYGYLIPTTSKRVDGVTWWKCHCLGKSHGSIVCKQGSEDIWVRHGNLVAGLHKSCGCMRYAREARIGDLRLRVEPATAADYERLGMPAPSWIPLPARPYGGDEFTDDDLDAMIARVREDRDTD